MAIESVEQALADPGASQTGEREQALVDRRLRPIVLGFCRLHLFDEFHMRDLVEYVNARLSSAPESAGRILRLLRTDGVVDFDVVNRRQSLYVIRSVHTQHPSNP
jgi:hypothetical protein